MITLSTIGLHSHFFNQAPGYNVSFPSASVNFYVVRLCSEFLVISYQLININKFIFCADGKLAL